MEYGLQLNVGDKFLVNIDELVNRGMWKHRYNGHWLRVEKLCPPEKKHPSVDKPARYLVEWYKEDNPGLDVDPNQFSPDAFYWLDRDWSTYIRKAHITQTPITATLPDI